VLGAANSYGRQRPSSATAAASTARRSQSSPQPPAPPARARARGGGELLRVGQQLHVGPRVGQVLRAAHHQRATERLHREHDPRVGHPLRSGHLHQHALQSRLGPGRAALAQPGQGILGTAEVVGAAGQPRVHVEPRLRRCQKRLKHVNQLRLEDVERRLLMGQQHHLKACDRHVAQQAKFSQVLRHCLLLVKELLELRHLGVPSAIAPALQVAAAHADLHDHRT
jgi:hypothetical protein